MTSCQAPGVANLEPRLTNTVLLRMTVLAVHISPQLASLTATVKCKGVTREAAEEPELSRHTERMRVRPILNEK